MALKTFGANSPVRVQAIAVGRLVGTDSLRVAADGEYHSEVFGLRKSLPATNCSQNIGADGHP